MGGGLGHGFRAQRFRNIQGRSYDRLRKQYVQGGRRRAFNDERRWRCQLPACGEQVERPEH